MDEVLRIVGVIVVSLMAVVLLRVVGNILFNGIRRVSDVREEGGGVAPKIKGELIGGQRRPSSSRAHGLHIRVDVNGRLSCREKSVIAKELA
jgi:hypothetical protein